MTVFAVLLYLLIILISVSVFYIKKRLNYWHEQGIAHEQPHLLAGNFQGLYTKYCISERIREIYDKFKGTGPFCGLYYFQKPCVLVLDLNLAKNILIKDFSNFTNRGMFHNERDDPLTGHLFLLDGLKWRNLRHKLSPTFTSGKMKFMYPTIIQVAKQFVDVLQQLSNKENVIEIKELLARFTTDIIGTTAFGINCNSLKDPNAEFRLMGKRCVGERIHNKFVMGFLRSFPELAEKLRMKVIADDITRFFVRIVRETVAYRETHNVQGKDFLSILMELKNDTDDEQPVQLTIEQMAAQAFVFFVGGFETSSSVMGFALYELAQHPDIQQKLRLEIQQQVDDEGNISYEAVHNLNYLGQVITETLRKYTILSHLNRQALTDYVVPGHSNYVIRKGTTIFIPSYGFHHDADIYPQPEVFNPDRFDAANAKQRDAISFLGFGDGPRNCIGMRFGLMQTRVGLAYLLQNFQFSVCEKTEIPLQWNEKSFLLCSKNGIFLQVDKI